MIELTEKPIDPQKIYARLSNDGAGSVVIHYGVVKPVAQGRRTRGLRFTPGGDLRGEIRVIEEDLRKKWNITDSLLVRRVGELSIGDIIMVIAVSSPDREAAFGACREAVERFKKLKLVKKEELFEDG
jgi:molybdopterin synthase catalytic subunit